MRRRVARPGPWHVDVIKTVGSLRLRFPFRRIRACTNKRVRMYVLCEIFPAPSAMTLPRFRCVGVPQVHPWCRSTVIQRRVATARRSSLLSVSLCGGVSSACADDHVDRSLVVRSMTWHFMITPCITLSRNGLQPFSLFLFSLLFFAYAIGSVFRLCWWTGGVLTYSYERRIVCFPQES